MKDYGKVLHLFKYDESVDSCLVWAEDRFAGETRHILKAKAGSMAGGKSPQGYWDVKTGGETFKVHRLIWTILVGDLVPYPLENIDHIDGNRSNNILSNLRVVTRRQNSQNHKRRIDNTSGVTGVSLYEKDGRCYYASKWRDIEGFPVTKYFSFKDYGQDVAFEMACKSRSDAINYLNNEGQDYTTRHGTVYE